MHNECKATHEMEDNGCTEDNNTEIGSGDVEYIEERETDEIHAAKVWMVFFLFNDQVV